MGRVTRPPKRPEIRTLVSTTALSIQLLPDLLDKSGDLPFRERPSFHSGINPNQKPIHPGSPSLLLQPLDEPKFIRLREGIYRPLQISHIDTNRYACHEYLLLTASYFITNSPGRDTTFTVSLPL